MVIYAISDLEGFHPSELIPNYNQIIKNNDTEVIICGDVFDSTPTTIPTNLLVNKSNNLRTIYEIVTQSNLKLTFGNRDLNKMKVGPLTILKTKDDSSNYLVSDFNNGLLDLNVETYNKFNACVLNLDWVHKMSNWYPFWGGLNADNIGYWKNDNEPIELRDKANNIVRIYGFFEKRFQKIFGPDTSVGTMSAGNLLETIPRELKCYNKDNNDFNAFVVLAVFKSMLLKPITKTQKYESLLNFFENKNTELKQIQFRGLLYRMFTDPKNDMIIKRCECTGGICKCQNNENMYLFSHGGVSNDIINKNTLELISNELNHVKSNNLRSYLTDAKQSGGNYEILTKNLYKTEQIEDKILSFNQIMKLTIEAIFYEDYTKNLKPSNNMLLLLIASASFDCESFRKKINGGNLMCSNLPILNKSSDFTSTMAGIKRLRKEKSIFINIDNSNTYNIFGHNPNGFCSTVDLYINDKSKTYLINLDTSNTFLGTGANQKTNGTSSYLKINGKDVSVHTNISIKTTPTQILINANPFNHLKEVALINKTEEDIKNNLLISFTDIVDQNIFMQSNVTNITFDCMINDEINQHVKQIGINENIFYHGFLVNNANNQKYILLTYHRSFGSPFPKCLVILKESEFNTIFPNPQLGGKYLNKYLKYKQKYISLKKQLEN